MLVNETKTQNELKEKTELYTVREDLPQEAIVVLHLNKRHKDYKKFVYMLQDTFNKRKGLITYMSGV